MTSELKIIANQSNAKKSTGPRSEKGKRHSRFNALKSGVHARTRVLPGEDKKGYEELAARMWEEIQPQGFFEEAITDQIIGDFVALWRIERSEIAYYFQRADEIAKERVVAANLADQEGMILELPTSRETLMHEARGTKPTREDLEAALAETVGKEMGDVYERIDRRRRSLMRDIIQKYRELDYLREKRLPVIEGNAIKQSA